MKLAPWPALRFSDPRIRDLALKCINAFPHCLALPASAFEPLVGQGQQIGNRRICSPNVDVCGTAAGILETQ